VQLSFWLANHSLVGQRSLEDVVHIMSCQLRALGHRPVWDKANNKLVTKESGINVVVEGFTPQAIAIMKEYYEKGARFLILATEEPTDKGFNHGTQKEMVWRQQTFPEAAKYAEGIIHLVPGQHVTDWYAQFAPAAYAELGYAQELLRPGWNSPTYEFGFYGSLTPRRVKLLKRLAKMTGKEKAVRVVGNFATQDERDTAMRDAKVVVQVRKFDEMGLVSSSRCCTALAIGRPVIAEPHELSKPWDEIVHFSPSLEAFYAEALVAAATWRGLHAAQFSRWKEKLPPEVCLGAALATVGVQPERKVA